MFPLALLVATGTLIGITVVLSKAAAEAGFPAVAFSFWQVLIGGTIIVIVGLVRGIRPGLTLHHFRYYAVTGLCSIGLPNTILFLSVPHIGTGHASIGYALPALLTYLLALALRMERPQFLRMTGLAMGALGALLLVGSSGADFSPELNRWVILILLAPITVAIANIYRTLDWPNGATPEMLAGGMLLAAALWIAPVMFATGTARLPGASDWAPCLAGVISAAGFVMSFALQRLTGPVTFSQLGYVVIAVAMGLGAVLFGEQFGFGTLGAIGIILIGLFLTTSFASRRAERVAGSPSF